MSITIQLPEGTTVNRGALRLPDEESARSLRKEITRTLGGVGRPPKENRCPCGEMTRERAAVRYHKCM